MEKVNSECSHTGSLSPTRSQRHQMKLTDGRFRTKGDASCGLSSGILCVANTCMGSENEVKLSEVE